MALRPTRRLISLLVCLAAALGAIGGGAYGASSAQQPTPLATTDGEASGQPVDGIACDSGGTVEYHIHVHVAVFINGVRAVIPAGIGIAPPRSVEPSIEGPWVYAGSCFYWLHTHTADGVIHIEPPNHHRYTLGNFFDLWRQPLSASQVGPAVGRVTTFVNGRRWRASPAAVPLRERERIQLDVGAPVVPPRPFRFLPGL